MENEDVVGAAPTGDAPTISEWSTISLTTQVRLILDTWWYCRISTLRRVPAKIVLFLLKTIQPYRFVSHVTGQWETSNISCARHSDKLFYIWIWMLTFFLLYAAVSRAHASLHINTQMHIRWNNRFHKETRYSCQQIFLQICHISLPIL